MRIALVCDWYEPRVGGIELHLHDLARQLGAAGHEVEVITTTPGAGVVDDIPVHRIAARRAPRFGFACTPAGLRRVAEVVRGGRFDVVHSHVSIVSPVAFAGGHAAHRAGIPGVLTFHSVVPRTRWLATAANAVLRCSSWNATFSAVSRRVAHAVQPLAGAAPVHILPNGMDAQFWRAVPRKDCGDGRLELVSVMRLNPKKRPFALLSVMHHLKTLLPGTPVRLRVVGGGPLEPRLQRAIAERGLGDRIQLLGRRSRADIRELFSTSDIFVLPAVRESFGLAALEARAAGLPVVAMAASGVAESIEDGVEGLLARSDAEIADHVATLTADAALFSRMRRFNRTTPVRFDWPAVVTEHLNLYAAARQS